MARKLKSDKVLFTATLLLVCASVVMVYSASAIVALERFQQANLFLDAAGAVGRARPGRARHRDAGGLPHVPERGVHLGAWSASSA